MSLEFTVVNGDGAEGKVGVNDIVKQLGSQGEQVLGVSADGSTIKMQDATGQFDAKTEDILKDLGWQISGAAPINPNFSSVNPQWRQAITLLPADDHKKAYLEGQFKKAGMEGVNIVGSGRDWYAFDPEANQYLALTNSPEWDSGDLREGLASAPRVVGGILGGAAGAVAGGGANPLTGALGAAGGSAIGDAGSRYMAAQYDPILKEVMGDDLGAMAKDVALNAGYEGLAQGAFLGIPKLAGALAPGAAQSVKSMMQSGPLSTLARGVGGMAEEGGRIVNKAARSVDAPFGREIVAGFTPGAAEATLGGMAAQLPGQAVRGVARGIGALGESETLQRFAPGLADRALQGSKRLLRQRNIGSNTTNEISKSADNAARWLGGDAGPVPRAKGTTADILGNVGEMFGMTSVERDAARKSFLNEYKRGRARNLSPQDSTFIAEETAEQALPEKAKRFREFGRKAGRGIQNIENFGKGMEKVGTGIAGGMLKTARAGSYVAGKGGSAVRNTAKLAQPLENKMYMRYGAEELYRPEISPSDSWQERRKRAKLGTILADQ